MGAFKIGFTGEMRNISLEWGDGFIGSDFKQGIEKFYPYCIVFQVTPQLTY